MDRWFKNLVLSLRKDIIIEHKSYKMVNESGIIMIHTFSVWVHHPQTIYQQLIKHHHLLKIILPPYFWTRRAYEGTELILQNISGVRLELDDWFLSFDQWMDWSSNFCFGHSEHIFTEFKDFHLWSQHLSSANTSVSLQNQGWEYPCGSTCVYFISSQSIHSTLLVFPCTFPSLWADNKYCPTN